MSEAPEGSKVIGEAELTITPTAADVPPVQIVPKAMAQPAVCKVWAWIVWTGLLWLVGSPRQEDEFEDAREDVVKPRKRLEAGACAAEENGHAEVSEAVQWELLCAVGQQKKNYRRFLLLQVLPSLYASSWDIEVQ
eukprot:2138700-Amphidinium_carterae.2